MEGTDQKQARMEVSQTQTIANGQAKARTAESRGGARQQRTTSNVTDAQSLDTLRVCVRVIFGMCKIYLLNFNFQNFNKMNQIMKRICAHDTHRALDD